MTAVRIKMELGPDVAKGRAGAASAPSSKEDLRLSRPAEMQMRFAREAEETVYENHARSIEQVATGLGRQPAFVARALRLSYLAPDIIAAIIDMRSPST